MGYLAIDPGGTNGWAFFNNSGFCEEFGQGDRDELKEFFKEYFDQIDTVIIENFKLFKKKALQQSGSDMVASRVIGAVEEWCKDGKKTLVKQDSSILSIAQLWSGRKMPKNHAQSHWVAAYNHGYYYLAKNGIIKLKVRPEC
jgi:hypothetical protein